MSCENCELAKRCDVLQDQAEELRATVANQAVSLGRLRAFAIRCRDADAAETDEEGARMLTAALSELDKASKEPAPAEQQACICPEKCDCELPNAEPARCSNQCPEHNLFPLQHPDCPSLVHRNGAKANKEQL